jgi:hypothetical protein
MTTITQFPDPPSTADPANFSAEADAFIAAFPNFVDEINEFGAALNNLSTTSTSVSSVLIGTGTKNFTVEAGKSYFVGMSLKIANSSTNYMVGEIISYDSATGALSVNVVKTNGSGTLSSWVITLGFNGIVDFGQTSGIANSGDNTNITSLTGTTTNNNAAAGKVGEYIESIVLAASAVSLTTGTQTNITSISLTAGDWDVSGAVVFIPAGTTTVTQFIGAVNSVSATLPTSEQRLFVINQTSATPGAQVGYSGSPRRFSLAATTTIYLIALSSFGTSTMTAHGKIAARRIR